MDKQLIAQDIRDLRMSYTVEARSSWDRSIHNTMLDVCEGFTCIGIYAAMNGEVDTYGIMESLLWDPRKGVCVPRVLEDNKMEFVKIESLQDFKEGRYGILEPTGHTVLVPDLMIIPVSAFNSSCYRIGFGGGYYDRYLSDKTMFKVGLAYSFQKVDVSFQTEYDVACDLIVTESEIYYEKE